MLNGLIEEKEERDDKSLNLVAAGRLLLLHIRGAGLQRWLRRTSRCNRHSPSDKSLTRGAVGQMRILVWSCSTLVGYVQFLRLLNGSFSPATPLGRVTDGRL